MLLKSQNSPSTNNYSSPSYPLRLQQEQQRHGPRRSKKYAKCTGTPLIVNPLPRNVPTPIHLLSCRPLVRINQPRMAAPNANHHHLSVPTPILRLSCQLLGRATLPGMRRPRCSGTTTKPRAGFTRLPMVSTTSPSSRTSSASRSRLGNRQLRKNMLS